MGTIYKGESLFDLYLFSVRYEPRVLKYIAPVAQCGIRYKTGHAELQTMERKLGRIIRRWRRALSMQEIDVETRILLRQGHKRLLLVAGEAYPGSGIDYVLDTIDTVYAAREDGASIRRVNVNLAPLSVEDFRRLGERHIGTFQLFQGNLPPPDLCPRPSCRAEAEFRLACLLFRPRHAGRIDDVGMGLLYGLYDWRFVNAGPALPHRPS